MTVKDIFKLSAALIGDKVNSDPEALELSVPVMNILLQESFKCENSMRIRDGQETLASAPFVTTVEDEIPYHEELVRAAMPYGVAWQLHQDAGNFSLAATYRNMFIDAVNSCYCFQMRKYT